MKITLERVKEILTHSVWETDLATLPRWQAGAIWLIRTLYVVIRDLMEGQLNLRAMSLVFTTLLTLVPMLAVSFSVLKAFGAHNHVEPALLKFLEPLGDKGIEISNNIIGFVDNIKVGVLGSLGTAFLIYTVISLIQKVESAFNYVWRVRHSRSLSQRFSNYLSVIMVGPLLVFSAIGMTASLTNSAVVQNIVAIEPFGSLYRTITLMIPYLLIIAAFTFTYIFMPNTKVRFGAALIGGIVAGVLWNVTSKLFATFVVQSAKYTAIYSGFAIVLVTMIWMYINWLIMLVGSDIAFYRQHPEFLVATRHTQNLSSRMRERFALQVMMLIGQHYYNSQPPLTLEALSSRLKVSVEVIGALLNDLINGGLLSKTLADPPEYLPAQPLELTTLKQVLDVVRSSNEGFRLDKDLMTSSETINGLVDAIDLAIDEALQGKTVKDLAVPGTPAAISSLISHQPVS